MTLNTEILADSPTAYWRLGESSGTAAADSSGNGHTATYTGGFTLGAVSLDASSVDTAVTLDGATGYVDAGDPGTPAPPTYTFSSSGSWAVLALAIRPTPGVGVSTSSSQYWGDVPGFPAFNHTSPAQTLDATGASVGDLLVAQVTTLAGQTVTPPAGWTTISAVTGAGTSGVTVHVFWKIAGGGDLGTHTFTLGSSARASGCLVAYQAGTFDAGLGVIGTASAVSSSDGTVATGPASPGAAGDFVIECVGYVEATGATAPGATVSGATQRVGQIEVQIFASINEYTYSGSWFAADFTVEFLFATTQMSEGFFLTKYDDSSPGTDNGIQLLIQGGQVWFAGRDGTGLYRQILSPLATYSDGLHHHYCAVRRGTVWELWVDGCLVVSADQGEAGDMSLPFPLYLGMVNDAPVSGGLHPNYFYGGVLDEVAIYDGVALSGARIRVHADEAGFLPCPVTKWFVGRTGW